MFENADKKEAIRAAKAAAKIAGALWKEPDSQESVAAAMEHPKFWAEAAKKVTPYADASHKAAEAAAAAAEEKRRRLDEQGRKMREEQRAAEGYWQTQAMEGIVAAGLIAKPEWVKALKDDYAARKRDKTWQGAFLTEKNGVDGQFMFCLSHLGRKVDILPELEDTEFGMTGLCISYTSIDPHKLSDTALASWTQHIKHLRLAGLSLSSLPSWVLELGLDSLDISDNDFDMKTAVDILEAFAAGGGTHIALGHLGLDKKIWKKLTTENFPNIRGLCLAGNPVKQLPEDPMENLEYLDLSGTNITMTWEKEGSAFQEKFPSLKTLLLHDNDISPGKSITDEDLSKPAKDPVLTRNWRLMALPMEWNIDKYHPLYSTKPEKAWEKIAVLQGSNRPTSTAGIWLEAEELAKSNLTGMI